MTSKSKAIARETEDVSDRDNQPVLAYRVGQLELAMKDATLAQRESAESNKQSAKELSLKMDNLASNFATIGDVERMRLDKEREHAAIERRLNDRIDGTEARVGKTEGVLTWIGRTVIGAVIAAVLGLVVVTKGQI